MKFAVRILSLSLLFTAIFLFLVPEKIKAAVCDAVYPANVVNGQNYTVRVELPVPSGVSTSQLAVCPQDSNEFNNNDGNDPTGRYCYRFSACNTGVSGAGGCNTGVGSSWYTPGNGGTLSADGRFLEVSVSSPVSMTFKLESNDLRNSSSNAAPNTRVSACSAEWRVAVSGGTATCDAGTFSLTGAGGTMQNPLTLHYDGTKTHNFFRGTYNVYVRAQGSSSNYFQVTQLANIIEGGSLNMGGSAQGSVDFASLSSSPNAQQLTPGTWEIVIQDSVGLATYCNFPFVVDSDGVTVPPTQGGNSSAASFQLCNQATTPEEKTACQVCVRGGNDITDPTTQGYWTAFGCVTATSEGIVQSFLRIGMGLAGGFVLLSILYGAFLLTTSSGDPKRVQEGQEMISSAVMGLLFVIFSIVILRFIGVSILRIPGFGA